MPDRYDRNIPLWFHNDFIIFFKAMITLWIGKTCIDLTSKTFGNRSKIRDELGLSRIIRTWCSVGQPPTIVVLRPYFLIFLWKPLRDSIKSYVRRRKYSCPVAWRCGIPAAAAARLKNKVKNLTPNGSKLSSSDVKAIGGGRGGNQGRCVQVQGRSRLHYSRAVYI